MYRASFFIAHKYANYMILKTIKNCQKATLCLTLGLALLTSTTSCKENTPPSYADLHGIDTALVAATSPEARHLYHFLRNNYGENIISGMMGFISWNHREADSVGFKYGKTPLVNGFDYLLMCYPGTDYNDITPVQEWAKQGGIVSLMWHWNVPKKALPSTDNIADQLRSASEINGLDFYFKEDANGPGHPMEFDISQMLTPGTWENAVYEHDMAQIIAYLKLVRDANIPVLWRPFHEASGAWFWWGVKGPEPLKAAWIDMFNRFKKAGLNNLIWVWTCEEKGWEQWYPGDEYVDIVGYDIYCYDAPKCAEYFNKMAALFPHKIITLSECGYGDWMARRIDKISDQWNAGARWSWFMPWYDYRPEGKSINQTTAHADTAWWNDAISTPNVLWMGDYK